MQTITRFQKVLHNICVFILIFMWKNNGNNKILILWNAVDNNGPDIILSKHEHRLVNKLGLYYVNNVLFTYYIPHYQR